MRHCHATVPRLGGDSDAARDLSQPWLADAGAHAHPRALAALRSEGVLIVGSGSWTHDLGRCRGQPIEAAAPADVDRFGDWMQDAALAGDTEALLAYRDCAPFATENHPSEEHLLPLFVAAGAGGGAAGQLHRSIEYGLLRMDAYAFG